MRPSAVAPGALSREDHRGASYLEVRLDITETTTDRGTKELGVWVRHRDEERTGGLARKRRVCAGNVGFERHRSSCRWTYPRGYREVPEVRGVPEVLAEDLEEAAWPRVAECAMPMRCRSSC